MKGNKNKKLGFQRAVALWRGQGAEPLAGVWGRSPHNNLGFIYRLKRSGKISDRFFVSVLGLLAVFGDLGNDVRGNGLRVEFGFREEKSLNKIHAH